MRDEFPHAALPSKVGLRESRHVVCGHRFDDAIANGSYRVDIHHQDKPGITLRYLDGTQHYYIQAEKGRWRPETSENPTWYQIPLRSIVPKNGPTNLVIAGRMTDADPIAHGAIRVMVNMNQTGVAAGVSAFFALTNGQKIGELKASEVRKLLGEGGSVVI